ncbi:MAG: 6-phosphofructokinase [Anaerolineae bacterium]|nr:6-phosphofructokinase [Anaerolineae bacterium]
MTQYIGILTAGGDSPGLNAAIRGVGKAGLNAYGMQIIGFRDGFRGLMENRTVTLNSAALSGILTIGGTILGTSRDKPQKMPIGSKMMDMTDVMVETYHNHHLDALVCLGGGGTAKNAYHLMKQGLNIITLPKTIDNDVAMTDITFGYDTALTIATEAIDRLHSTAHSHHRIIVVEVMGHNAGWLALGAGIAGGADVILIPEIPYSAEQVATSIRQRVRDGKGFSIVAVSEGAVPQELHERIVAASKNGKGKEVKAELEALEAERLNSTQKLTQQLEGLTGLESRVTILGHVQRGGIPSPADRLLATRLGAACARYINEGIFGVMVAARGDSTEPVPLEEVVGKRKTVPLDHPWIETARNLGINLGD